jgi:hypothetical protein
VPVDEILERPLDVGLRNGVWHITTSVPKQAIGMQLVLEICQSNGRVLRLGGSQ